MLDIITNSRHKSGQFVTTFLPTPNTVLLNQTYLATLIME